MATSCGTQREKPHVEQVTSGVRYAQPGIGVSMPPGTGSILNPASSGMPPGRSSLVQIFPENSRDFGSNAEASAERSLIALPGREKMKSPAARPPKSKEASQPASDNPSKPSPSPSPEIERCPVGSVCLYENFNFAGRVYKIESPARQSDLRSVHIGGATFDDRTSSVINNSDLRLDLFSDAGYSSRAYSLLPHHWNSKLSDIKFDDVISSFRAG
ncbi:peptidase inhibitor family I36 protein [Streptomyces sp. NBC_01450]|uniref:peptidase inhibitor family I36 protein n=1 Tax=Streptomyces sp. NBC_01450 TaxID=2903871 RepID=UPI003FCCD3E8